MQHYDKNVFLNQSFIYRKMLTRQQRRNLWKQVSVLKEIYDDMENTYKDLERLVNGWTKDEPKNSFFDNCCIRMTLLNIDMIQVNQKLCEIFIQLERKQMKN
jgi:hypothetical protein